MNNDITEKPCKNHINDSISQECAVKYEAIGSKRTTLVVLFSSFPVNCFLLTADRQNPGVTSFQFMSQVRVPVQVSGVPQESFAVKDSP